MALMTTDAGYGRDARAPKGKPMANRVQIRIEQTGPATYTALVSNLSLSGRGDFGLFG